ncbi:MAG: AbrB family transcriptional regulator [Alphaproteobacteria bacterium]
MLHIVISTVAALVVGGLGGAAASWFGITGGWLIGSLIAAFAAGLTPLNLAIPKLVRSIAMGYAGLTVGATISHETLQSLSLLPWTIAAMILFLAAIVAGSYLLHRGVWKADPPTAISCVWPGNVMLAFAGAEAMKADMERVTIVQTVRLLALVMVLPLSAAGGAGGGDLLPSFSGAFLLAILFATVMTAVAIRLRMVGGELFLTAGAVGAFAAFLDTPIEVPTLATHGFQVVVGAYIGLALAACRGGAIRPAIAPAISGAVLAAVLTLAASLPVGLITGRPATEIALAFAPGGAEAMILLAAVFDVDAGFVGLHHTVRLLVLTLLFPIVLRAFASAAYQDTGRR